MVLSTDGLPLRQLQRKWIYFHGPATGQKAVRLGSYMLAFRVLHLQNENDQNDRRKRAARGANGLWDGDDGSGLGTL